MNKKTLTKQDKKFLRICFVLEQNMNDECQTEQWRNIHRKVWQNMVDSNDMKYIAIITKGWSDLWHERYIKSDRKDMDAFNTWSIFYCIEGLFRINSWLRISEQRYSKGGDNNV